MELAEAFINMDDANSTTDADIRRLRAEAGSHGDTLTVATCDDALDGEQDARGMCCEMIQSALDMLD